MSDRIEILAAPLDVAAAIADVIHPSAGGIDVFLGTTRAEQRVADERNWSRWSTRRTPRWRASS
jgi:molybdopterin synthase catalytic subunit